MNMKTGADKKKNLKLGMFLVTIGIVYGDIGTSPLYVMKSIVAGNGGIGAVDERFIIGALSLVIWTVTLLTTIKFIVIALKADNHGEGGIFALYSLVKNHGKWLIVPAMLGGAALLADGVLTPAVTVTTAVEGLRSIEVMNRFLGEDQWKVVIITLAIIFLLIMVIWYRATQLERKYRTDLKMRDHVSALEALSRDENVSLMAHNLVYLDNARDIETIDRDILYSILDKDPKRAQAYWFVSVNVLDEPQTMNDQVETYGSESVFRIRLNLGFKCSQRVNVYLRQIVQDLQQSGELPLQDKRYSIYGKSTVGSFKFCIIHKSVPTKTELSAVDEFILNAKYAIRHMAGSKVKWYGLDNSSLIYETVPLFVVPARSDERIPRKCDIEPTDTKPSSH